MAENHSTESTEQKNIFPEQPIKAPCELLPAKPYAQRQKERREARLAKSLCGYCGKPAMPKRKRCEECAIKQNASLKARRAGPKHQDYLAQLRQKAEERAANNLCPRCGRELEDDLKRCSFCRTSAGKQRRRQRKKLYDSDLCRCGKPRNGRARCKECSHLRNEKQRTLTAERVAAGLCQYCGKKPPISESVGCEECLAHLADLSMLRRRRRLAAGLCVVCGKNPHTSNSRACPGCYMKYVSSWTFRTVKMAGELQDLLERQDGCCAYSGLPLTLGLDAEIDHIVPESAGGPSEISNLQWVHTMVNQMKFNFSEEDFLRMIKTICVHRHLM